MPRPASPLPPPSLPEAQGQWTSGKAFWGRSWTSNLGASDARVSCGLEALGVPEDA